MDSAKKINYKTMKHNTREYIKIGENKNENRNK